MRVISLSGSYAASYPILRQQAERGIVFSINPHEILGSELRSPPTLRQQVESRIGIVAIKPPL